MFACILIPSDGDDCDSDGDSDDDGNDGNESDGHIK